MAPHPDPRGEGGQSVVEFALGFVLFLIMVGGIIDVGRAVWLHGTLQEAVQAAARTAIVHGSKCTDVNGNSCQWGPTGDATYAAGPPSTDGNVTAAVRQDGPGLTASQVNVTTSWPDGNNDPGSRVTVTATYPFSSVMHFVGISITMSASATAYIQH